jgi:L-erythro-3,5-diaminohexanoate dehydrogenase
MNYDLSPNEHLGLHRVLEPKGVLPQQAVRLDPSLPIKESELLIEVDALNIDSASFHQFINHNGGDLEKTKAELLSVINSRGKLQNPVTGSGGMLIGRVKQVGRALSSDLQDFKVGDRIATLVSLTLTPLSIRKIKRILPNIDRVEVEGHAILFNSGLAAKIPDDLDEGLVLAALDVCGAPAQTALLVERDESVVVIGGGGKSGLLCLYEAKRCVGPEGIVVAFDYSKEACDRLRELSFVDEVIQGDAKDAVATSIAIKNAVGPAGADVVINVANVPGTEMASILSTRQEGCVYFFSMATSFTAAALGAEGVGADVDLIIGNGYTSGHAEHTIQILRESAEIRTIFQSLYASKG